MRIDLLSPNYFVDAFLSILLAQSSAWPNVTIRPGSSLFGNTNQNKTGFNLGATTGTTSLFGNSNTTNNAFGATNTGLESCSYNMIQIWCAVIWGVLHLSV